MSETGDACRIKIIQLPPLIERKFTSQEHDTMFEYRNHFSGVAFITNKEVFVYNYDFLVFLLDSIITSQQLLYPFIFLLSCPLSELTSRREVVKGFNERQEEV